MKLLAQRLLLRAGTATRKLLQPEQIQIQPFEGLFRVTSDKFQFVIARKPSANMIYTHECSTPAAVLKKPGIHILPQDIPDVNRREKWSAVSKQIESAYENAFKKCATPRDAFHLDRKIRGEIRNKLFFVGCLDGRKHKHLLKYTSFGELLAESTLREYEKKGVAVQALGGERIFPSGKVWMPTNEKYLLDYAKLLGGLGGKGEVSMLDIGCGSGVLSFLFAKQFKKGRICAIDSNPDAVRTCNLNAARMGLRNIQALECDVNKGKQFERITLENKLPKNFDYVVVNPPWMASSKIEGESPLVDGVYDDSQMLKNSFALAKKALAAEGRIILIYSDLAQLVGLERQSVEQLCQKYGLLVEEKHQRPLAQQMVKKSAIGEFKAKAKIITLVLRRS